MYEYYEFLPVMVNRVSKKPKLLSVSSEGLSQLNTLEIRNLTLAVGGKVLLSDITMDIWKGHVHAIVGPNGAGKSTLAQTIMGLSGYRDFDGDIVFEGTSLKSLSVDERARLGMTLVFQEPARFEGLSVSDFILAGAKEKSASVEDTALAVVGLDPERYRKRSVDKTLSGGERKRIELASVYAMKPRLLLMDEPDSGVDIDSVQHIFTVIRELKQEGTTVILITHSPEVLKQADHAFLLCCGRMVDKGTMEKMYSYFNGRCIPCNHAGAPNAGEE
jgi:Fe-S cluster assembly ATP-binding protein